MLAKLKKVFWFFFTKKNTLPFLLLASCTTNTGECHLGLVSKLPIHEESNHVLVDMAIDGKPAHMVFDTGSFTTLLTDKAVERLALQSDFTFINIEGVGGSRVGRIVNAHTIELGGLHGKDFHFVTAPVGPKGVDWHTDGLLSSDFLSKFDIDLDYKGGFLRLYAQRGDCASRPNVYLTGNTYGVPIFFRDNNKRPLLHVIIDGKQFTALLDTGSDDTAIFRTAARTLGFVPDEFQAPGTHGNYGIGPRRVRAIRHMFQQLEIGDLIIKNVHMTVLDQASSSDVDILLGNDFLHRMHIWLSYSSKTLVMEYPPKPSPPIRN